MKREPGMAYDTKVLNKIFAVVSVIFLLVTVWMVFDDYIRPWKAIQVKALDIEKQKIQEKVKEIDGSLDGAKIKEIKNNISIAEKELKKQQKNIDQVNDRLAEIQKKIYVQNMVNGVNGSQAAAHQFQYEHALMEKHDKEAQKLKVIFDDYKAKEIQGKDALKGLQAEESKTQQELNAIMATKTSSEKELKSLLAEKDRLVQAMSSVSKDPIWALRNAPFIDYLDPTIKIRQYVVQNATNDFYFQQVPKIDRCTTCHVFIDKPGYEDQENPYKTHPNVQDLAVGANSAHPAKEFGCTSCHGGVGDRVNDFNSPAHIPQNKEQEKEWVEKYHWHEPHKVPQAMLPLQYTQGMCLKCHKEQERIPMADKFNKGRETIESYGCYACHKIDGWQHLTENKPGPSLLKVTSKVKNLEWIRNWIWNPFAFNPKSRMPHYFQQLNNSKAEFRNKNMTEVNAMADYIVNTSQSYKSFAKYTPGDADNGKQLMENIGCVGCHQVEGIDDKWNAVGQRKGPYLVHLGSKVDPDWLVSWLKQPNHYDPTTIMPSFRLSEKEANDIATYLLASRNSQFEGLKFPEMDKKLRDEILVEDYFSAFETIASAKNKLSKMSDAERTEELAKRSINKYGCYSCHEIKGFEGDLPQIGPELSKEGSKPVEQFGFGQQKQVPHTRQGWLTQHLKSPSIWDVGVPKPFKDLNKMPNFYLSDKEIEDIVGVILGMVSDKIPLQGQKRLKAGEKMYWEGMKVANKYNCYGCHEIDGVGGALSKAFDDQNYGPPYLSKEGARVQTDWLYRFLKQVHPIRTYVNVRMPSFPFTHAELNKIVMGFQGGSDQPTYEENVSIEWEPGEKEAAKKIWDELACTTCHTLGFTSDTPQAPNLHYAKGRLRTEWMEAWITNPQGFLPYTSMPAFWDNGSGGLQPAVEGVLDNDPKRQIRAIRKFVQEFGYSTQPSPFPYQPNVK
jgi:cbb3-type cytochrome oxidase cytochrome c subunit